MAKEKEKKYIIDNPALMAEWDWEKNAKLGLNPKKLTYGSNKKSWWICDKGHEWQAKIQTRSQGHGCPYCTNKKLLSGFNDLLTTNSDLSKEWHPSKNGELTPSKISGGSETKVWWLGNCGHEWETSPKNRTAGNDCPICSKRKQSSFPEQCIFFYIKHFFPDTQNKYTNIFKNKMEIDVFIPTIRVGIEYDGLAFHKSEISYEKEKEKYFICKQNNITLIRVREFKDYDDTLISDYSFYVEHRPSYTELSTLIYKILDLLGKPHFIDVEKDKAKIQELYYSILKEESLAIKRPDLVAEWHPHKNGNLTPNMFSKSSSEKVWWKCENGHEWQAVISSRYKGNNCPYCSGKKLLVGYNDLATINPLLAAEWHPTKNNGFLPSMVQNKSNYKVWWKCSKGHEWQATISHRSNGSGCPYCSGRTAIKGVNDLLTLKSIIADLWHPTLNGDLHPRDITVGSEKNVWWLGKCGHQWQRTVKAMTNSPNCPYCIGRKLLKGFNDLSTINPTLASEWHPTLNEKLSPSEVTKGSGLKVWWKCTNGHEWMARIADRTSGGGCPLCTTRLTSYAKSILTKRGSLLENNQDLCVEWDYSKNALLELYPDKLTNGSHQKVWWICSSCGNNWMSVVKNRVNGSGCPQCAKQKRKELQI